MESNLECVELFAAAYSAGLAEMPASSSSKPLAEAANDADSEAA